MNYNYLIFVPSLVTKANSIEYKVKVDGIVEEQYPAYMGIQTNEAVTKFTIDYLKTKNESLNKIIMLCTDEVRNNPLDEIDGKTTLEYYTDSIKHYLLHNTNVTEEKANEIFEIVPYIPGNNDNEDKIIESLRDIVKFEEETSLTKRVYIDFTGGVRSAALTLVFVGRILNMYSVEVEKIFYSNLKKDNGELRGAIEECTNTYRIFSKIEDKIKAELGEVDENDESESAENFRKMKNAANMNQESELLRLNEKRKQNLQTNGAKKDSFMDVEKEKTIDKKSQELAEEAKYPLISIKKNIDKNQGKTLAAFREKIAQILYDYEIIQVKNKKYYNPKDGKIKGKLVSDEIAASYNYYIGGKGSTHTFNDFIKQYINLLNSNKDKSPKEIKDKYFGDKYFNVDNFLNDVPKWSYKHNDYSRGKCRKKIIKYVKDSYDKEQDLEKIIQLYQKLDCLYMGYGFPFACTYGGNEYFHGYDELYFDNFKKGVKCLEEYYNGVENKKVMYAMELFPEEQFTYESFIEALADEKYSNMLHRLFPYILNCNNISAGKLEYKQWSEFMFEFAKSYNIIKDVRNSVIHSGDSSNTEGSQALNELKKVISMIEKVNEN